MKTAIAIIAVLVILGGGAYALTKHNDKKTTPSTSYTSSPSSTPSSSSSSSSNTSSSGSSSTQPTAANAVTISGYAFGPGNVTVKKGTTVTWTNKDSVAHTVTETDSQTGPNSQDLNQGQSYSFTFNTAGTFKYDCSIHTYMTGTVTVTD